VPKLRYQPPDRLPGATAFSEDPELRGSLSAVQLVKEQTWIWDDLRAACELEVKYARKRLKGHWELAAVAFVTSGHVDIEPWWANTTEEIWQECGFQHKPSFQTTHRRLRELGKVCDEFLKAAALVIQRCREHDARVMAHVHFDWTEDETHAALIHDCQPGDGCAYSQQTGHGSRRKAKRAAKAQTMEVRENREKLNTEEPDDSIVHDKESLPELEATPNGSKTRRVRINGCWYRTRDKEAGIRAYTNGGKTQRFWHGYYGGKAIDHFTSGVIPSVDSASRMEFHLFPELHDQVDAMLGEGESLETAIGDKGLSITSCFEHATRHGTAPIFPWRKTGDGKRHDTESHDRHGVMRCKHCGGPTKQVKFSTRDDEPRLWFRCLDGTETPGCAKEQTIACSRDWRTLIPLARTQPLYHELKQSHQTYEATHDYWRDRYKVCADNLAVRPKAVGLDWHQLRAYTACLVEWLRIAKKADWLKEVDEGASEDTTKLAGKRCFRKRGHDAASDLMKARTRAGLSEPYGPKAAKLGLGRPTLPSERPKNKLKNQIALDLPGP
jgi:hypothetical protein